MSGFTDKQAAFVREYLVDLNATQAAIRAGYSARTANKTASRLLVNVDIQAAVSAAKAKRAEQVGYTAQRVLQRHAEIDEMDVADILDDSGDLLPIKAWPKVWRRTISGIEITTVGNGDNIAILKKVRWPDKLRNLELLGRHVDIQAYGEPKGSTSDLVDVLGQLIGGMPD